MVTVNNTVQFLLDSSTLESKLQYLQLLKNYFEGNKNVNISNAERLVNELHVLISSSITLALPAVDVLTAFIVTSKNPNIEHFILSSYPVLVSALKSLETTLIKALHNCILCCFQKTSDFSVFFTAIQNCVLDSGNLILQRNSMTILLSLAKIHPHLFDDSKYTPQILSIIESAVKYKSELGTSLIRLTQLQPSIDRLSKMLPLDLKSEYNELIKDSTTVERLKYGVIPEKVVKNLEPTANWKQRAGAIEELEEIISKESTKSMLEPTAFLEFLIKLLNDPNYKVAVTTLQIIKRLLESYTVIHTSNNVQALIPGLIEKLGDNKVMIRQLSMISLRLIGEIVDPILLLTKLLPHLSAPKWHTREEILIFIIIFFLENESNPGLLKKVPYVDLVPSIVPLLTDDKPKVMQMAFEAFAIISKLGDFNLTSNLLTQHINDRELLQELKSRIDIGIIPVLTEDGQLEFPYITKEATSKNSFDLQIQYNNLDAGKHGRFTSAGTTNKIDRNLFGVHSAANRIQADDNSGRASPRFGNGNLEEIVPEIKITVPNKSMESGPDWLTDWKDTEEKKEIKPAPRPRPCVPHKPISNESSRTDSTRAGSTEPNSRILSEKLKMLKAAKASPIEEDKNNSKGMQNTRQERRFTSLNPQVQLPTMGNTLEAAAYLTTEQITPLENPETEWYKCAEIIKTSNNWLKQFDACNIARRICKYHSSILSTSSSILHGFTLDLLRLVESLRSSLARNVLLLFGDLFTYGKRALEPDLDLIVPVLLKKGTESGSFLGSQAIDALKKMCETCSESRVVAAILSSISGFAKTTPQVRFRAITFLNLIARKLRNRIAVCKEGERIILALSSNLSEGSLEIRTAAKEGLTFISDLMGNNVEFEKLLQRSLNSTVLCKKVMSALAKTNQKNSLGEDLPNSDMKMPLAPKSNFNVRNSDVR